MRYLDKLGKWLQPQLSLVANLQAQLMLEQISQLQGQIHRLEEEIDQQVSFEASAERLIGYARTDGGLRLYPLQSS